MAIPQGPDLPASIGTVDDTGRFLIMRPRRSPSPEVQDPPAFVAPSPWRREPRLPQRAVGTPAMLPRPFPPTVGNPRELEGGLDEAMGVAPLDTGRSSLSAPTRPRPEVATMGGADVGA